jgi:hypothetical protein
MEKTEKKEAKQEKKRIIKNKLCPTGKFIFEEFCPKLSLTIIELGWDPQVAFLTPAT